VSNPPYVRSDEMPGLPPDVRDHEPPLALDAGTDGLDVIRRIAAAMGPYLRERSAVLIELSPEHARAAATVFEATGLFSRVDLVRDLDRVERVLRAVR
jgi:release factor glutamine methyltransferase